MTSGFIKDVQELKGTEEGHVQMQKVFDIVPPDNFTDVHIGEDTFKAVSTF